MSCKTQGKRLQERVKAMLQTIGIAGKAQQALERARPQEHELPVLDVQSAHLVFLQAR